MVQSHPEFRVPLSLTPRTRRSPGALRSPSPSRLTAREYPRMFLLDTICLVRSRTDWL